ncbi:MAG TPA: 50S ribosomal protein L3 [Nitrospirales bacterium]|nr:50S ribosomal protein L3 [Nitrospiraceae bacterium]HNP28849.1 50S ribosomal protein L3 [Nitrospirales bacterium]
MVKGLIGKKLGMIQVFDEGRRLIPVTVVEAGPCGIVQIKKKSTDGYDAVQVGFKEVSERKRTKAQLGHLKKSGNKVWRHLREFGSDGEEQVGSLVNVNIFSEGESIDVQGVSKGKGFQGVIKRHNYAGGPASHGSMFHRAPGSIGSSSFPSRVLKNKKLPGHMGNKQITIRGLRVFGVKSEENIILISGSVPGPVGGVVIVRKVG